MEDGKPPCKTRKNLVIEKEVNLANISLNQFSLKNQYQYG